MTVEQAINRLTQIMDRRPENKDIELEIEIYRPGAIGGTPAIKVNNLNMGFDWDNGRVLIFPEKKLQLKQ